MLTASDPVIQAMVVETSGVEVRRIVQRVLWNLQAARKCLERRRGQRTAFPYPLRLWPASECEFFQDGTIEPIGEGTIVMGKHLSNGGLDFYTREPIADRKVVVSLDDGEARSNQVLLELTWCRFGGHGIYLNGGRFLRALGAKP